MIRIRDLSKKQSAFTLIELLVVIVVLATLMAVALPLYLGAVTQSEVATCRTNMQTIANAEVAYRARNFPTHSWTTNISNLAIDLVVPPHCVRGGTYSVEVATGTQVAQNGNPVPSGGIIVSCSITEHGVFAPSIDTE